MGKATQGMDFICDIDGTLMNIDHRRHFVEDSKEVKSLKEALDNNLLEIEGDEWIFLTNKIKELSVKKDWKSFEDNIKYDTVNKQLNNLIRLIENIRWSKFEEETYDDVTEFDVGHFKNSVYYFSGRSEKLREITVVQILHATFGEEYSVDKIFKLIKNEATDLDENYKLWTRFYRQTSNQLLLRADKDYREDSIVKSEMLDKLIENEMVNEDNLIIFDDRQSVVDMWRSRGLTCFQVAKGDF